MDSYVTAQHNTLCRHVHAHAQPRVVTPSFLLHVSLRHSTARARKERDKRPDTQGCPQLSFSKRRCDVLAFSFLLRVLRVVVCPLCVTSLARNVTHLCPLCLHRVFLAWSRGVTCCGKGHCLLSLSSWYALCAQRVWMTLRCCSATRVTRRSRVSRRGAFWAPLLRAVTLTCLKFDDRDTAEYISVLDDRGYWTGSAASVAVERILEMGGDPRTDVGVSKVITPLRREGGGAGNPK